MEGPNNITNATENILSENTEFFSERLKFIPAWKVDRVELALQANDKEIAVAVGREFPENYSLADADWFIDNSKEKWVTKNSYRFGIHDKETGKFVGMIGFDMAGEDEVSNIGYWLGRENWGKGYAKEALRETLEFIKANFPNIKTIKASAYKYNVKSQDVLTGCGFVLTGEKKGSDELLKNGEVDESFTYKIEIK